MGLSSLEKEFMAPKLSCHFTCVSKQHFGMVYMVKEREEQLISVPPSLLLYYEHITRVNPEPDLVHVRRLQPTHFHFHSKMIVSESESSSDCDPCLMFVSTSVRKSTFAGREKAIGTQRKERPSVHSSLHESWLSLSLSLSHPASTQGMMGSILMEYFCFATRFFFTSLVTASKSVFMNSQKLSFSWS